jgi:hypothetical protein
MKENVENNSENLHQRLEKIIDQKSQENSALKNLLKKIHLELGDSDPEEDEHDSNLPNEK